VQGPRAWRRRWRRGRRRLWAWRAVSG
jgi:hypothetical protein